MNIIRVETARLLTYFGSLATDPICSAHKNFIYLTLGKNRIYPEESYVTLIAKKTAALVKSILLFTIGIPLGALGIVFRFIANIISPNQFLYKKSLTYSPILYKQA